MSAAFVYRRRVQYHECDVTGLIFHPRLYAYLDEALRQLARERPALAALLPDVGNERAAVTEVLLRFLSPIRSGDDIEIALEGAEVGDRAVTFNMAVRLSRATVAEGSIEIALTDPGHGRSHVPAELRSELAALAGG